MSCSLFLTFVAIIIFILICIKIYFKLSTGWCTSNVCLAGKTVIITGANTSIGYETAADMAKRSATVILACRNETKAKQAVEKLIQETDNKNISYKILDLSSIKSVEEFAADVNRTVDKLDILINNAGVNGSGQTHKTKDGFEIIMQTNYFGHFLLTHLLLDLLKKSTPSRIINVASNAAAVRPFPGVNNINSIDPKCFDKYCCSKLCNILFTIELDKRLKNSGVTAYTLHPGIIDSDMINNLQLPLKSVIRYLIASFFKNRIEGAQTTIYCAVTKDIEKYSGKFFVDCRLKKPYKTATDPNLSTDLWEKTEELLNLKKEK